jgi:hypothetical protein
MALLFATTEYRIQRPWSAAFYLAVQTANFVPLIRTGLTNAFSQTQRKRTI